jgi:opacity protein-like surface antigen
MPFAAFPDFDVQSPVALRERLAADSCGTAGFGLEWAFWNNWSLRAEYDYVGLSNQTFTVAPGPTIYGGDVITFNNRSISIMTMALNYKFGGW